MPLFSNVIRKRRIVIKYISLFVLFLISGCASNFLDLSKTASISSPENHEVVAKKIYNTAKQCWVKKPTLLLQGVVVGSDITLDGIVIRVGHSSSMDYIETMAIQFIVQEYGDGSIIDLYERKYSYIGQRYFEVAHEWLMGNYTCTLENV